MASIIEGYSYDIFISYRQKDNKYDGWVTGLVDNLKKELEATFKEEISVYFDKNPHDGLLETHDIDASLKEKLKCLVFIPIISRTYCDLKSFAWEHEFKAFVEQASQDQFGLKIRLPNGNTASRVLPVHIHDLDFKDNQECEKVLGGLLRGVEFIYKEPGVNRPLTPYDDEKININKTRYRNQINKVALAIKEIISGLKKESIDSEIDQKEITSSIEKSIAHEKSIIVLPFENISPDPDQEYFSDGLTEEIITDLSHINDLLVISRSSAMTFKGIKKTIPEIARSVNVRYVLEGSVRKAGNNLRITAQLIDSKTDTHIWADKYTGTLDDVFDIQENVSKKIVEALKGHLTSKDSQKLVSKLYDKNAGVYDAYSRAHHEFWKYEPGSHERALHLLENAVEAFGEHPLLLSGIGAIHWQFYHQLGDIKEYHLIKVMECANKIFAADPRSAHGHRLMSYIDLHAGNTDDAIRHLYQAMHGDAGDTETLLWLSYLLAVHAGQPVKALPIAERWRTIDPLQPLSKMSLILIDWMNGEFQKAIMGIKEWKEQEPDNPIPLFYLGHILTWTGQYNESLILAEHMYQLDPNEAMGQCLRFLVYALLGEANKAKNAVTHSTKESIWMDFHTPWIMAEGYSVLGEQNEALKWLERAIEKGHFNYPMLSTIDPLLANIRNEPRFKKLMNTIKLKWENFEV
jgi:TolB-like protein